MRHLDAISQRPQMQGVSLVELNIALLLGASVVLAMSTLFVGANKLNSFQQGQLHALENGRFALDFIARDARLAGYRDQGPRLFAVDWRYSHDAYRELNGRSKPDAAYDRFALHHFGGETCYGAPVDSMMRVTNAYFIRNDALYCRTYLFDPVGKLIKKQPAQALIDGVVSLQVLYGIDENPPYEQGVGVADYYLNASGASGGRVVSLRVAILVSASGSDQASGRVSSSRAIQAQGLPMQILDYRLEKPTDVKPRPQLFQMTVDLKNAKT